MRALIWTAPLESRLEDQPEPLPGPGQRLMRVRACGVCGSDLHGYRGHSPVRVPPLILGHEVVADDADGNPFVINPLTGCGRCRMCRSAQPNLCPDRGLLGLDRPGAFAEYVAVPEENLLPLPAGMPDELGTLVEPLATPINALGSAPGLGGGVVAVLGAGPIGLLTAYAARRLGARFITCQDLDESRLEHAGVYADAVSVDGGDIADAVNAETEGLGADLVVDAVGVEATWSAAIELVRPGGTVAVIGLGQASGELAVGDLVRGGITVRGVYAYTPSDFASALAMLDESPPSLDWVTEVELERGPEVLAGLAGGDGPIKAVFRP